MTPQQFQAMVDTVGRYRELEEERRRCAESLTNLKQQHAAAGLNVEFIGYTCGPWISLAISRQLCSALEGIYEDQIAACESEMEALK